jgi:hypothetical protein
VLLDQDPCASLPKHLAGCQRGFEPSGIAGDPHALAARQPVGLEHERKPDLLR